MEMYWRRESLPWNDSSWASHAVYFTWWTLESLKTFCRIETAIPSVQDGNEIDLDDDGDGEDDIRSNDQGNSTETKSPDDRTRLLVLGTGCATPSPSRGASGYALIFPALYPELGPDQTPSCFSSN